MGRDIGGIKNATQFDAKLDSEKVLLRVIINRGPHTVWEILCYP